MFFDFLEIFCRWVFCWIKKGIIGLVMVFDVFSCEIDGFWEIFFKLKICKELILFCFFVFDFELVVVGVYLGGVVVLLLLCFWKI